MTFQLSIIFTSKAEAALQGETGRQNIYLPDDVNVHVGDSVALLLPTSKAVQTFVCTERLWDVSQISAPRLEVTLDVE